MQCHSHLSLFLKEITSLGHVALKQDMASSMQEQSKENTSLIVSPAGAGACWGGLAGRGGFQHPFTEVGQSLQETEPLKPLKCAPLGLSWQLEAWHPLKFSFAPTRRRCMSGEKMNQGGELRLQPVEVGGWVAEPPSVNSTLQSTSEPRTELVTATKGRAGDTRGAKQAFFFAFLQTPEEQKHHALAQIQQDLFNACLARGRQQLPWQQWAYAG